MVKKVLLLSSVLFGLLFFEMAAECFADTSDQLEQAKTDVISLINSGDDTAVQAAIVRLTTDFAKDTGLPEALYYIAGTYAWSGKFDKAGVIYQDIITDHPGTDYAPKAQMDTLWMNALSSIDSGNETAAQAAIAQLTADFAGSPRLPESLYHIAKKYGWSGRREEAKSLYQKIITDYAGTSQALEAQMDILWVNAMSSIESEPSDKVAAQAAIGKLTTGFSTNPRLPELLYHTAKAYGWSGQYEEAKKLYQRIIQQYPNSLYAGKAQLDTAMMDFWPSIKSGNDSQVQAAIDKLTADFAGHPDLPDAMSRTAEQYYMKASQLQHEGLTDKSKDCFQKAATIWETVINEHPSFIEIPKVCCWAGDCYRKLGKYEKSIVCYQKVADDYPGYGMAWNALFLVGRNYENLKKSGAISKSEADSKTRAAYKQLLERYPDCKAAKIARRRLKSL